MSQRCEDRLSEGTISSTDNFPAVPPDSPGSSVSTRLQEEYDELLKYAVVMPEYNPRDVLGKAPDTRGPFDKQDNIITLRASPPRAVLMRDMDREAKGGGREEFGERLLPGRAGKSAESERQLPDFGGESTITWQDHASFKQHQKTDSSGEGRGQPPIVPMFPSAMQNSTVKVGISQQEAPHDPMTSDPLFELGDTVEMVYTTTVDQDVGKMETLLDQWCLDLKRNVLAEFSQAKIKIEQRFHHELLRETNRHSKEKADLVKELDNMKEYLHTYGQTLDRKDSVIANLTKALYRQRDKLQLLKNFSQWRSLHNDVKREAFTIKMAQMHYERTLKRRVISGWFSLIHRKWRTHVEKACQTKAQQICRQVSTQYEAKISSMNEAQEVQRQEIRQLYHQRESYEEAIKKAFMRGVCALNMEAMSIFHADDKPTAETQGPPSSQAFAGREEGLSDSMDAFVPEKGPTIVRFMPQDQNQNNFMEQSSVTTEDPHLPKVVTSQGSKSMTAAGAPSRQQTSAKATTSGTAFHKGKVVVAKVTGKGTDSGRPGSRSMSPTVQAPMASVIVERHQPVTKQTIGPATAARFARPNDADKFRKLAGQQGPVGKPPSIHTVRVVD